MAADKETEFEFSKLTKVQKLAGLLIMLGAEGAGQILRHLDEHEIEAVSGEMTRMTMLTQEIQSEILREFSDVAVTASTLLRGGVDYTQVALEKAVGVFKASNVITRVAPSRAPVAAMQQLIDLDARQLLNLVKHEQPQTIALVTSYLTPDKAAQLLSMLPTEQRDPVVERLATLAPTPIEVVEKVVEVLNMRLGSQHVRALNQTGGVKAAANLLNALDRNASKSLLISLEEHNPELGQAIRQKMFTFEDVARLDTGALQKTLREVDMRDLAVALKTASEQLKTTILGCISRRAAETVAEEMSFMGSLKLRDIEAAQMRIIEVVRRLESEGEIELGDTKEGKHEEAMA